MAQYRICHSPRLSGEVQISTAKNAVLPILAASLLTQEEVLLHQMPRLTDVDHMLGILRSCGAETETKGADARVRCVAVDSPSDHALLRTMRASWSSWSKSMPKTEDLGTVLSSGTCGPSGSNSERVTAVNPGPSCEKQQAIRARTSGAQVMPE